MEAGRSGCSGTPRPSSARDCFTRCMTPRAAMQSSTEAPPLTELQQRDNLCGPFHAARVLRELGITEWQGERIDQDLVALHADSALPEIEDGPQVPPGATNLCG